MVVVLGILWIPAKGDLSVEDGVWTIKGLIHQGNLLMDRFLCKDMINECETWERDKNTGKCKVRGPNHTIDPLRYFIWYWQVLARRGEIPEEDVVQQPQMKLLTEGQLLARQTFVEQDEDWLAHQQANVVDVEAYNGQ